VRNFTERLLTAVHQFKDKKNFKQTLKIFNEFKNNDFDAITIMTGIKADRRGYRTIFSSLLKYIKNEKFNLNQN
jgi:hypothetical protein